MKKHESNDQAPANIAILIENLCGVSWFTADPDKPWLVKAAASVDFGYQILLTDLEHTYFCAGDAEMVKFEKKVSFFVKILFKAIQPYYKNR